MKRVFGLEAIEREDDSFVTVGTFDGVHIGHQAILHYLMERAEAGGGQSVVVSFDPHPRTVINQKAVPLLTTIEERAEILDSLGLDRFIVLPFTRDFAALPPEAFVEQVLVNKVGLQEIVIGYDHGFGRGRRGDSNLLESLGDRFGFSVDVIPAQVLEAHVVSSTEIRRLLMTDGDVARAAEMLGRNYQLSGIVIRGDARGKTIGFPTANMDVQETEKVVPLRGVYAVLAQVDDGADVLGGMMNIGIRPTFEGTEQRLEVHLFDTDRDLYDRQLRIEFVERIRDERKFDGIEALKKQLSEDRSRCKRALEMLS